jgi:hypothetical protein
MSTEGLSGSGNSNEKAAKSQMTWKEEGLSENREKLIAETVERTGLDESTVLEVLRTTISEETNVGTQYSFEARGHQVKIHYVLGDRFDSPGPNFEIFLDNVRIDNDLGRKEIVRRYGPVLMLYVKSHGVNDEAIIGKVALEDLLK